MGQQSAEGRSPFIVKHSLFISLHHWRVKPLEGSGRGLCDSTEHMHLSGVQSMTLLLTKLNSMMLDLFCYAL